MPDAPPSPDELLDRLLRAAPLRPRELLEAAVLEQLRQAPAEDADALEEWLEEALAAWPLTPAPGLSAAVLAEVGTGGREREPEGAAWRAWGGVAAALAACLALVWTLPESEGLRSPPPAAATVQTEPFATTAEETTALLLLAEGLQPPARWLLEENAHQSLALAQP
ncbi:MAG: hypothetical protein ACLFR7_01790 [Opitutales bacterium]